MKRATIFLAIGGVMLAGVAGAAYAQQADASATTPSNFNYELRDGKRVPKADSKTVAQDGTVREEYRSGKCVTVKEVRPDGAVKKTERCE